MAKRPVSKKRTTAKATSARRKTTSRSKPAARSASPRASATPDGWSDRDHLIDVIRDGTGSTKVAAKGTLDAILSTLTASLKKNKRVQIAGFGTFAVGKRAARMGRNPQTGEAIRIKASKSVRFKAGTRLKGSL